MKNISSLFSLGLIIVLYYILWTLTLPFFIVRLFVNVASGDDDDDQEMTKFTVLKK